MPITSAYPCSTTLATPPTCTAPSFTIGPTLPQLSSFQPPSLTGAIPVSLRAQCQYLYFCTSGRHNWASVAVKQVNSVVNSVVRVRVPEGRPLHCGQILVKQVNSRTSKTSKFSRESTSTGGQAIALRASVAVNKVNSVVNSVVRARVPETRPLHCGQHCRELESLVNSTART
jgi:hypothetical protein